MRGKPLDTRFDRGIQDIFLCSYNLCYDAVSPQKKLSRFEYVDLTREADNYQDLQNISLCLKITTHRIVMKPSPNLHLDVVIHQKNFGPI